MKNIDISKRVAVLVGTLLLAPALLMAQAGSLDPTFGTGGIVTTSFGGMKTTLATAAVIQSDGKILVAGALPTSPGVSEAGVVRYTTTGSLDSSFGTGGVVITSGTQAAFGIALQSDGKIVVAASGTTSTLGIQVIRYNTNGSLDTSFGTGGIANVRPFNGVFFEQLTGALLVEPNGKILVAADTPLGGSDLVSLLTNGQLDLSFGTDGAAPLVSLVEAMALLPSGKILIGTGLPLSVVGGGVTRYTSTGSLDTSFGFDGQATGIGPSAALATFISGKFIAAGSVTSALATPPGNNSTGFELIRYNANGTIDTTFGTRGAAVTPFPGNSNAAAFALAIQSNGDILLAGQAGDKPNGGPSSFALARYTSNGHLDTTFGVGGLVTTAFGSDTASVSALAIQSDGKIVAVGNDAMPNKSTDSFALARYLSQ